MPRLSAVRDLSEEAIEEAFLRIVASLPEAFIECRTMQHSWTLIDRMRIVDSRVEKGVRPIKGELSYARRVVQCSRCRMKRFDAFRFTSRLGHSALRKIGATYDTSECETEYAIKGLGSTAAMRDLLLGTLLEEDLTTIPVKRGRPRKATA